jgi:hypothetical protein
MVFLHERSECKKAAMAEGTSQTAVAQQQTAVA